MHRRWFGLGTLLLLAALLAACAGPQAPAQQGEIKIGVIIPYTGVAAAASKSIEQGIELAVQDAGGAINGRQIVLVKEDETDDPQVAVTKARKLVEQDGVAAVLGPQLAHTAAAVGGYLAPSGVPHIGLAVAGGAASDYTFAPGSGAGDAYPTGEWAYDQLGARKAAIMFMDYLFGQQLRDGFKAAFTAEGGSVASEQPIPFGTSDMSPFLENVGDADLIAVFLTAPADMAFVRQYRELGLSQKVLFISNAPQEEPLLAQMGDNAVGMYGSSYYSPEIQSDANRAFVEKYRAAYNAYPGAASQVAYLGATMYLAALKATNGDTSGEKITQALLNLKDLTNPGGTVSMGPGRIAIHDQWIFEVGRVGDRYAWVPVTSIPAVQPR